MVLPFGIALGNYYSFRVELDLKDLLLKICLLQAESSFQLVSSVDRSLELNRVKVFPWKNSQRMTKRTGIKKKAKSHVYTSLNDFRYRQH